MKPLDLYQQIDIASMVAPVIKKAGAIVLSHFNTNLTRHPKIVLNRSEGFVTPADLDSEQCILSGLQAIIPDAQFNAEESGKTSHNPYCWVIDPLDGTTNFAHGLPYFCISIALTYHDVPLFGMIYQPVTDELFWAIKGKGAYKNGQPIATSHADLDTSLLAVGASYATDKATHTIKHLPLAAHISSIRMHGSASLDIAYVAAGKIDGAVFEQLKWWDIAAGTLLVEEAGGVITDFEGKPVDPYHQSIIAAGNSHMHKKLLFLLKPTV